MTTIRRVLATSVFAILATTSAMATTLLTSIQTNTTSASQTNDSTSTLGFTKFDPSLGTLTSVHVTIGGFEETGYTVTDQSNSSNNYTFTNAVVVSLKVGSITLAQALPTVSASGSLTAGGTQTSPGYPARNLTNTAGSGDMVYTDAATLLLFNGPGSINLISSAHSNNAFSADGDVANQVSTRYVGTATLQYDYTQTSTTPEPMTLTLMGSALVGIGLLRKKLTVK
jgi:hypothetical protein